MNLLFFTDTHIDDQPQNEYRWQVFNHVREAIREYGVGRVYNLGDMWTARIGSAGPSSTG